MSKEKTESRTILDGIRNLLTKKKVFKLATMKADGKELVKMKVVQMKVDVIHLEQMKTDDGVVLEAEVFEAGQSVGVVTDDGIVALPAGEYLLENGKWLFVVEEGIIDEIREAEDRDSDAEGSSHKDEEELKKEPKKIVESVSKETFFSKEDGEKLTDSLTELATQFKTFLESQEKPKEKKEEKKVEMSEDEKKPTPIKHNPEKKEIKNINYAKGLTPKERQANILFQ